MREIRDLEDEMFVCENEERMVKSGEGRGGDGMGWRE